MSTKKMRRAGGCAVGWDVPGQGALVVPGSPRLKDGPPLSRLLLPNPGILSRVHPLDCLDVRAGLVEPGGHAVLRFMWWEPTRSTGRRASRRTGASHPFARHQQIGRALDRSTLDAQRSTLDVQRKRLLDVVSWAFRVERSRQTSNSQLSTPRPYPHICPTPWRIVAA